MSEPQKIDKILEGITDIRVHLAQQEIRLEQQRKEIDDLTDMVNVHDKTQTRAYTVFGVVGIVFTTFINWLLKQH